MKNGFIITGKHFILLYDKPASLPYKYRVDAHTTDEGLFINIKLGIIEWFDGRLLHSLSNTDLCSVQCVDHEQI